MENMDMTNELDELEMMFGQEDNEMSSMQKVVLTQNLDGFASCFPEWDLHPPIRTGSKAH